MTLRSKTFAKAASGCVSNASPQVAPALASRMSTCGVMARIWDLREAMPDAWLRSAGQGIARAEGRRLGRALRAAQAEVQADELREEIITREAPA